MTRYKSCKFIQNGINFFLGMLKFCHTIRFGPSFAINRKVSLSQIQDIREKVIKDFMEGNVSETCKNCPHLEEKDWDFSDTKVKYINISHWLTCSSSCFYCFHKEITKSKTSWFPKKSKYYDIYPILSELYETNQISDNVEVSFIGGEVSMLREFDKIMKLLNKNNAQVHIYTNAIHY